MKKYKYIIGALSLITILSVTTKSHASDLEKHYNSVDGTFLGKSINVVEAKKYSAISDNNVLNEDYYMGIDYYQNNCYTEGKLKTIQATSKESIKKKVQLSYSIEDSVKFPYDGFTIAGEERFESSFEREEKTVYSSSYYEIYADKIYYQVYMENVESKYDDIKNNLSSLYLNYLDDVQNGKKSFEDVFKKFGTHIITSYVKGDKIYMDAELITKSKVIDSQSCASISASLSASVGKDYSVSSTAKESIMASYNLDSSKTYFHGEASTESSVLTSSYDIDNFGDAYNYWLEKSDQSNGTIISYGNNGSGLLPIYEVLPSEYENLKDQMREAFINYSKSISTRTIEYDDEYEFGETNTESQDIATSQKRVKDCDRFSNPIDYFDCSKYGLEMLTEYYKYMTITVKFEAKKIDKGVRYLYIYNEQDAKQNLHNSYLAYTEDIEGESYYIEQEFTFSISLSDLYNTRLALVWRASGSGDDDWVKKNVNITCVFTKDLK